VSRAAEPSRVEQVQRQYGCGYCGAHTGEQCTTERGSRLAQSHSARYYAAVGDGALPLPPPTAEDIARGRVVP
jgi:hypothetical protein